MLVCYIIFLIGCRAFNLLILCFFEFLLIFKDELVTLFSVIVTIHIIGSKKLYCNYSGVGVIEKFFSYNSPNLNRYGLYGLYDTQILPQGFHLRVPKCVFFVTNAMRPFSLYPAPILAI